MADVKERVYLVENSELGGYDGNLYEVVERFLGDSMARKIIIVHLAGSHMDYTSKYPNNHKYFYEASLKDDNEHYQKSHPMELAQLARHVDALVSHDQISHTLMRLVGLHTWGYEAKNDISSPSFQPFTRNVIDRDGNLYSEKELSNILYEYNVELRHAVPAQ